MTPDSLLKALGEAKEGSRELDCLIAPFAGWHRVEPRFHKPRGAWIAPENWLGTMSSGSPILDSLHGTTMHRDPPMFSRSLDAALTLVPEGCVVELFIDHSKGTDHHAELHWESAEAPSYWVNNTGECHAKSAPLALCIAALRSRSSDEGG